MIADEFFRLANKCRSGAADAFPFWLFQSSATRTTLPDLKYSRPNTQSQMASIKFPHTSFLVNANTEPCCGLVHSKKATFCPSGVNPSLSAQDRLRLWRLRVFACQICANRFLISNGSATPRNPSNVLAVPTASNRNQ